MRKIERLVPKSHKLQTLPPPLKAHVNSRLNFRRTYSRLTCVSEGLPPKDRRCIGGKGERGDATEERIEMEERHPFVYGGMDLGVAEEVSQITPATSPNKRPLAVSLSL